MIELNNVSKIYTQAGNASIGLHNISLSFNKGEIVAITGPSGCGKSTLLNVICGVDTYEEGEIYFEGEDISYFDTNDMDTFRRKYVSFIYQNYNIIDSYTVLENVMTPLLIDGKSYSDAKKKAIELIKRVGLEKRLNHKGSKLSGGEKQRCIIARALANDAPILACDEPTGNLDSKTGKEIIELLKEVSKDKLLLIVTHNFDEVKDIITRNVVLKDGEIVSDIVIEKPLETEKEVLNLDNKKINNKALLTLGLKNIKNTPRKTILLCLVMILFSFLTLYFYSSCYGLADDASKNPNRDFNNTLSDRAIYYDLNYNKLLKDVKLDGVEIYKNAFYEETRVVTEINNDTMGLYPTNHLPAKYGSIHGRLPKEDNEAFIFFPKNFIENLNNALDKEFNIYGEKLKLTGYAMLDSDEKQSLNLLYSKHNFNFLNNIVVAEKGQLIYKDNTKIILIYDNSLPKNTMKVNLTNIDKTKDYISLGGIYKYSLDNINIIQNDIITDGIAYFNFSDEFIDSNAYQYVLYGNLAKIESYGKNIGYSVIIPSKSGMEISFSTILFFFFGFFLTCALIAVYFITYIILSRIYQSRIKDYSILRSLGIVKKQMARIVDYEILILMVISSILALVIFIVLGNTVYYLSPNLAAMKPLFIILYFVVILIFGYHLSKRFNKKLFKFSVSKSIREVEE